MSGSEELKRLVETVQQTRESKIVLWLVCGICEGSWGRGVDGLLAN